MSRPSVRILRPAACILRPAACILLCPLGVVALAPGIFHWFSTVNLLHLNHCPLRPLACILRCPAGPQLQLTPRRTSLAASRAAPSRAVLC